MEWTGDAALFGALLEEDAASVYEEAPCGYVTTRTDGTILRLNRTLAEWLGYERDSLLGRRVQTLLSVGGRIYFETHYAPLLAMQGYVSEVAFDLLDHGGNVVPTLFSARLRRDRESGRELVRTVVFNATDRRRYERELLRERERAERYLRAKTEVLRMLSHDVRTPVGTIMNVARLLAVDAHDDAARRRVRILQDAAQGILALVNRILDAERLDATELQLDLAPVALAATCRPLMDQFRVAADQKGIALELEWDPLLPERVITDALRLGQVLSNLLGNAVKFTARGGVTLALRELSRDAGASRIEFSVRDTGHGIPANRLRDIFTPFEQLSAEIRETHGGSGLGLTICQQILERMNSRLEVESTPGAGSTFRFILTLAHGA